MPTHYSYLYCRTDMDYLRNSKIKQVLKEIENDIESTIRGNGFYNKYLPSELKDRFSQLEEDYTRYCFGDKYKSQLKNLGLSNEQIEEASRLILFKNSCFYWETSKSPGIESSIREPEEKDFFIKIEKEFNNPQRLQRLEESYTPIEDKAYNANTIVARSTRWKWGCELKDYYNVHISKGKNDRFLEEELHNIEYAYGKNDSPEKQNAIQAANDYHKLRSEGANTPPEVLERLVKHERNHEVENRGTIAVIKIGEINEELGIIKQPRAAEVFPEYESVKKTTKQLDIDIKSGKYDKAYQFVDENRKMRMEEYQRRDGNRYTARGIETNKGDAR